MYPITTEPIKTIRFQLVCCVLALATLDPQKWYLLTDIVVGACLCRSVSQAVVESVSQPDNQPANEQASGPVCRSGNHIATQWAGQSISPSIRQSVSQSVRPSVNTGPNQKMSFGRSSSKTVRS